MRGVRKGSLLLAGLFLSVFLSFSLSASAQEIPYYLLPPEGITEFMTPEEIEDPESSTGNIIFKTTGGQGQDVPDPSQCSNPNEMNCRCFVEVAKAMDNRLRGRNHNVNMDIVNRMSAARPFAPGSENINTTCSTAKFYVTGNPEWFLEYFLVQHDGPQKKVGLFGKELFSSTYMSLTVGNILAVKKYAEVLIPRSSGNARRDLEDLVILADDWLKSYIAFLAMGGFKHRAQRIEGKKYYGDYERTLTGNRPGGTITPGTRSYVNGNPGGTGLQSILLGMALNLPSRNEANSFDLNGGSPGYYGGIRAAVVAAGMPIAPNGHPSVRPVSPSFFGLSGQDRIKLKKFIRFVGRQNSDVPAFRGAFRHVIGMISPKHLQCDMTFLRTTKGIAVWFGKSTQTTQNRGAKYCSTGKGGVHTASTFVKAGKTATFLAMTPATGQQGNPGQGRTWRVGNMICSASDRDPGYSKCIDLPRGEVVYEVVVNKKANKPLKCVDGGACEYLD